MLRYILLYFIFFIHTTFSISQNIDEHITRFKGKVSSIQFNAYNAVSIGDSIIPSVRHGKYTDDILIKYDATGKKTDQVYYTNGQIYFRYGYEYDHNGKLLRMSTFQKDATVSDDWTSYTYDTRGRLTTDEFYYNGRPKEKNLYEYNKKDQVIKLQNYYWASLSTVTTFEYDTKGNKTGMQIQYVQQNNAITSTTYIYDNHQNLVDEKRFDSNGELDFHTIHQYNDLSQLIESKCVRPDSSLCNWYKYEYNDHGDIIKQIAYYDNEEPFERTHTTQYEYDSTGNWIKQTIFYQGEPSEIRIRKIVYQ